MQKQPHHRTHSAHCLGRLCTYPQSSLLSIYGEWARAHIVRVAALSISVCTSKRIREWWHNKASMFVARIHTHTHTGYNAQSDGIELCLCARTVNSALGSTQCHSSSALLHSVTFYVECALYVRARVCVCVCVGCSSDITCTIYSFDLLIVYGEIVFGDMESVHYMLLHNW